MAEEVEKETKHLPYPLLNPNQRKIGRLHVGIAKANSEDPTISNYINNNMSRKTHKDEEDVAKALESQIPTRKKCLQEPTLLFSRKRNRRFVMKYQANVKLFLYNQEKYNSNMNRTKHPPVDCAIKPYNPNHRN